MFEEVWGVGLQSEPGLRIPNMFDAALDGNFKGLYIQGEDIVQSDPNTKHVAAGLGAMECVVVQDLFLNETASYAHVFLPGSLLPGEGRHLHQRRAPHQPRAQGHAAARPATPTGKSRMLLSNALGYEMNYTPPVRDHGRDRPAHAHLRRRRLREARPARQHPVALQRQRARGHARPCTSTASCAARACS